MLNITLLVTGAVTRRSRPVLIRFIDPRLKENTRLKKHRTFFAPSEWLRHSRSVSPR